MANRIGQVYGLTIFSPLLESDGMDTEHASSVRRYLGTLSRNKSSPFARVSGTHFARLVVMDDVVFVGAPAREEHLQSRYLVFEANFDGDLDKYLDSMAREIPGEVDSIWKHCVGYPGVANAAAFAAYMKKCQVETTFFFADVCDRTVPEILRALQVQSALAHFIEKNQGRPATEIQMAFGVWLEGLSIVPSLLPGGVDSQTAASKESVDG